eukprot:TRINITY_DN13586_c0_g1_i1.p1 TRINITY_DN13586_c0_g1~~TRINITY_DN13586_c0_g1_i1.p1  ORF type:complete len:141 (-),score=29.55 TRINITY_DN13586_c0_g1_i1:31-453(-)
MDPKDHITMTIKKDNPEELIQDLIEQADEAHENQTYNVSYPIYECVNKYAESYWVLYQLGLYNENGYGIPKNRAKALEFFQNAKQKAELMLDEDHALYVLGELYTHGYGVAPDNKIAEEYYKKAAAMGHKEAERCVTQQQ